MSDMDRPCSVADCDRDAECGGLMCPTHWGSLPDRLRAHVGDAWLAFQRHGAGQGRWVGYMAISRAAAGYFASSRPLAEASRSAMFPIGRVRPHASERSQSAPRCPSCRGWDTDIDVDRCTCRACGHAWRDVEEIDREPATLTDGAEQ